MSSRYMDFDKAMAERARAKSVDPVTFTYGGELYTLPAELPAAIPLMVMRMHKEAGAEAEVSSEGALYCIEALVGKEQFERLLATGIDTEALMEVLMWILNQYGFVKEADEQGNAPAPA